MRFLTKTGCAEWCDRHVFPLPDTMHAVAEAQAFVATPFAIPSDAGARVQLCRLLWDLAGGTASERLLWITDWGAWPSQAHMPLFKLARRALGEDREPIQIPGHLIEPSEADDGLSLFIVSCLFLWDAWLYTPSGVIVEISNDEVGTLYESAKAQDPSRRAALAELARTASSS